MSKKVDITLGAVLQTRQWPNDWWIHVWSTWAAQTIFLHLKFAVDASRLAYWLGKLVDMSRKSEKTASSKLIHRKYFPYSCFLYTSFCVVFKHFREVNSRFGIHSLSANDTRFCTSQRHWRLTGPFCVDTRMCGETTSFSTFSRWYTSMHVVLPVFQYSHL